MTIEEKIAEIKFKVDHRKLHPQEVHAAFYLLFDELERLKKALVEQPHNAPSPAPPKTRPPKWKPQPEDES